MRSPDYKRLERVIDRLHTLEEIKHTDCCEYEELCKEYQELTEAIDNYGHYCSIRADE